MVIRTMFDHVRSSVGAANFVSNDFSALQDIYSTIFIKYYEASLLLTAVKLLKCYNLHDDRLGQWNEPIFSSRKHASTRPRRHCSLSYNMASCQ